MAASVPGTRAAQPPQAPGLETDPSSAIAELLANLGAAGLEGDEHGLDDEAIQNDMAALQQVLRQSEAGEEADADGPADAAPRGDDEGADHTDGKDDGRYDEYDGAGAGYVDEDYAHGAYDDAGGHEHGEYDDMGRMEGDEYGEMEDEMDETPLVEMPAGLWPYEVWQQTHAAAAAASTGGARALHPKKLTEKQWDNLVTRLNESSKRKQQALAAIQARREADELAGSRFTPAISRRSKKIARDNHRLPDRVRALMERRQRRQDKLREEAQQREMSEATFKPKLSRPINGRIAHLMKRMNRQVGHLMQYDVDKQIRARQRQQLMQEIEARELTFSPRINAKSVKIFHRMRKRIQTLERKLQDGEELTEEEMKLRDGGLTRAARQRSLADAELQHLSTAEMSVKQGTISRLRFDKDGLSRIPGHEQEYFHPRINPRSRRIARRGGKAKAHDRLYTEFTKSHQIKTLARQEKAQKTLRMARTKSSAAFGMGNSSDGLSLGAVGLRGDSVAAAAMGSSAASSTLTGEPVETRVAYKPVYDFLVRRVLEAQSADDVRAADEDEAMAAMGSRDET